MAPKKKFTKEQVIDAAFEIAKKEGMDTISIRKVAEKMGSSIAPIYVNFNEVEELKREVMKKIIELSNQLLSEENSGHPFQDIGVASLRFAREYSVLFRDLVMKQTEYLSSYDEDMGHGLVELMKGDSDLEGFSKEELMTIFFKMRVFTVGLSVMVANGLLPEEFNEEKGVELLNSTATDVITSARLNKGVVD
ncbi:TetR/AcrR family transcriptional regulator [Lederbergia wuyishanensis]|uniref:AcrR family transcriptional regulator n=1 Tax=Lederbergia wuyishanensis TaxID=1347903 RepID=A0ABU0D5Y3_9BACI|nr:TetR/AcrR family transcriptional regulator [Lederbergia wuyishanensis]MCJ8008354.1 TetR/AcrR family transcriptional regulator [Lederbergia wuyishanensis]MDQ0343766.1 AcrR family transcriptional regulator [Lederbergia wuyishanensis]